ncbi:MAG: helix-turn-helix domain-containing protein [Gemmatimonadetes bacterium]|jgi:transcriptional regulator with XRE-family HTH domain|nr:helix-turn-helix domain-containing protein [Gemmatimonadota bacterium]MBT4612702.1 helix-turn-helix domain-containing protein [Gemmatimonadota bacterium]MBT5059992.1 helix-turn-helix domain-containing protein [Gemmatimonadota bacterium]MBT5142088.1 helix-turn-helix domain-containing protein [Gemmatimonadota bacterium]MBT5588478.1 helix-turn-helix domain-containing protein [Gemmatimonadota bacterium]
MPFDFCQIREFRSIVGLTQTQLAEKLQVPQCTVARWETGKTAPNASHIGEMCDFGRVAGIEPGFFFPAFSRCNPGQDRTAHVVTTHARRARHG